MYDDDKSEDKRAFKKFYSEFILQKAEEFNQRFLTGKEIDATSFYTYFTSTVPEFTENTKDTTKKEIQLLIDKMNLEVFELLKIQNGKKFLEFLTNNDIEKNKRVLALAAHFSPSLNKPINHYRELVRRNIKDWEDIQQDCKDIINEVKKVENHPEVDSYYIRSIAKFVETESSKIDSYKEKLNSDLLALGALKEGKYSELEIYLNRDFSYSETLKLKRDLMDGSKACMENTEVYKRRIAEKKHPKLYSALDKISNFFQSIQQRLTGKAPVEKLAKNEYRFFPLTSSNPIKDFEQFMKGPNDFEALTKLNDKILKEVSLIDKYSISKEEFMEELIKKLEPAEECRFQWVLQVRSSIDFFYDAVESKGIKMGEGDELMPALIEYCYDKFEKNSISVFDLRKLEVVMEILGSLRQDEADNKAYSMVYATRVALHSIQMGVKLSKNMLDQRKITQITQFIGNLDLSHINGTDFWLDEVLNPKQLPGSLKKIQLKLSNTDLQLLNSIYEIIDSWLALLVKDKNDVSIEATKEEIKRVFGEENILEIPDIFDSLCKLIPVNEDTYEKGKRNDLQRLQEILGSLKEGLQPKRKIKECCYTHFNMRN